MPNSLCDEKFTLEALDSPQNGYDSPQKESHPANIRKNHIAANSEAHVVGREANVLVIYTGGTIGMVRNKAGALEPIPNRFVSELRKYPNLHDTEYAAKKFSNANARTPLVLPLVSKEPRRIIYSVHEYEPLLDSSNMTFQDWLQIVDDIWQFYQCFDGFVILHGTDTLAYTSSALSFMLENLGKTVIVTGSQIPIFETRTDGRDNFTSALIIAGNYTIPEVCVLFGAKLIRGNRATKMNTSSLDAFESPNCPPIAKIGINVEVDYRSIFRPCNDLKFSAHTNLNENVALLRLFPSISTAAIKAALQPPIEGVVLQTFGSGNIPSIRKDLMQELKLAAERGVIIVNCTQCNVGSVAGIYQTGAILSEIGILPGFDMTPEAALTKLAYVLGKETWSLDMKKQMMQSNLRGELTLSKPAEMQEEDLIEAVARSLRLSTPRELDQLGATLYPAMVNTAVVAQDTNKIKNLQSYGADLSAVDYDQRTALHVACSEGSLEVVKFLILNGVPVHARDRQDRTPLMEAISIDHHEIIKFLVRCGAHITGSSRGIGEQLCAAAARGFTNRLQSYKLAGVDLSQIDPSGRTALHLAALHGHVNTVIFLLENSVDASVQDLLGLTPIDYAKKGSYPEVVELIEKHLALDP